MIKREDITAMAVPFMRKIIIAVLDYADTKTPLSGKNITASDSPTGTGRAIDAKVGYGNAASTVYPWNLYSSPFTGVGADPNAADRAKRFRILTATLNQRTPANPTDEFVAFGDLEPSVMEEDAVWTQVYAQCPITETSLGSGDLTLSRPTIQIVEGQDLPDAGVSTPPFGDDGSLPAYVIISLGVAKAWGGSLHFQQYYYEAIVFTLTNGGGCELSARNFIVNGGTPPNSYYE